MFMIGTCPNRNRKFNTATAHQELQFALSEVVAAQHTLTERLTMMEHRLHRQSGAFKLLQQRLLSEKSRSEKRMSSLKHKVCASWCLNK